MHRVSVAGGTSLHWDERIRAAIGWSSKHRILPNAASLHMQCKDQRISSQKRSPSWDSFQKRGHHQAAKVWPWRGPTQWCFRVINGQPTTLGFLQIEAMRKTPDQTRSQLGRCTHQLRFIYIYIERDILPGSVVAVEGLDISTPWLTWAPSNYAIVVVCCFGDGDGDGVGGVVVVQQQMSLPVGFVSCVCEVGLRGHLRCLLSPRCCVVLCWQGSPCFFDLTSFHSTPHLSHLLLCPLSLLCVRLFTPLLCQVSVVDRARLLLLVWKDGRFVVIVSMLTTFVLSIARHLCMYTYRGILNQPTSILNWPTLFLWLNLCEYFSLFLWFNLCKHFSN